MPSKKSKLVFIDVYLIFKLIFELYRTDKKAKTAKNGNLPTPETTSNDSHGDDDDELTRRIAKEAAELHDVNDDDNEDWAVDTSAEAVARRMKDLSVSGAVDILSDPTADAEIDEHG